MACFVGDYGTGGLFSTSVIIAVCYFRMADARSVIRVALFPDSPSSTLTTLILTCNIPCIYYNII